MPAKTEDQQQRRDALAEAERIELEKRQKAAAREAKKQQELRAERAAARAKWAAPLLLILSIVLSYLASIISG